MITKNRGGFIFPETTKMFWMSGKIDYHLTLSLNRLRRFALGSYLTETLCTGISLGLPQYETRSCPYWQDTLLSKEKY